jgi:hypothetical protein
MNRLKRFFQKKKRKNIQIKWKRQTDNEEKKEYIWDRLYGYWCDKVVAFDNSVGNRVHSIARDYSEWKARLTFENILEFISKDIFIQVASKFGAVFAGPAMVWSGVLRLDDILLYGGWTLAFVCCLIWAMTEIYRTHYRK